MLKTKKKKKKTIMTMTTTTTTTVVMIRKRTKTDRKKDTRLPHASLSVCLLVCLPETKHLVPEFFSFLQNEMATQCMLGIHAPFFSFLFQFLLVL